MHTYSIQSYYFIHFPCHQISPPALETQNARNALSQLPLHLGWTSDSILANELRGSLPGRIILRQRHRRRGPIPHPVFRHYLVGYNGWHFCSHFISRRKEATPSQRSCLNTGAKYIPGCPEASGSMRRTDLYYSNHF